MLTMCIVEDNGPIRRRVSAQLERMPGVRLLRAFDNPTDALAELPRLRPALTILDIGLPKMTGTELLARLLDGGFEGDVIMFTVFDHDEHLFRALELGARGYILKEARAAGAQRAVEEYLRGGAPMSPAIARKVLQTFRPPPAADVSARLPATLSARQLQVLELIAEGLLNKEIADRLGIAEATVKQHVHKMYQALSINNRAEAVRLYLGAR